MDLREHLMRTLAPPEAEQSQESLKAARIRLPPLPGRPERRPWPRFAYGLEASPSPRRTRIRRRGRSFDCSALPPRPMAPSAPSS